MEEKMFYLITKLRDEASFVHSEKNHLIEIYKEVSWQSTNLQMCRSI
jgi:hypothetical protein